MTLPTDVSSASGVPPPTIGTMATVDNVYQASDPAVRMFIMSGRAGTTPGLSVGRQLISTSVASPMP